jgi:hypothetical protein
MVPRRSLEDFRQMSEARRMPLSRLINDPFGALQERGHIKLTAQVADFLLFKVAAT